MYSDGIALSLGIYSSRKRSRRYLPVNTGIYTDRYFPPRYLPAHPVQIRCRLTSGISSPLRVGTRTRTRYRRRAWLLYYCICWQVLLYILYGCTAVLMYPDVNNQNWLIHVCQNPNTNQPTNQPTVLLLPTMGSVLLVAVGPMRF